jgi:Trypsin-like peptidase domain
MKRFLVSVVLAALFAASAFAQSVKVKVRAALYDRDLNLKPVPHLVVKLIPNAPDAHTITVQTTLDGIVETEVPAGAYRVVTDKPVELFDKTYLWEFEATFTHPENTLELSNDNAKITALAGDRNARVDELAYQYQRVKNAVVTVQTEFGGYDGFIIDSKNGLVLTVARPLEQVTWLAVQIDDQHKLPAVVVATDKVPDLAVLRIDGDIAGALTAGELSTDPGALIEGERVFLVENPGKDKDRILHTGVVSRADATEIVSDVAIHDAGSPLFNSSGDAVGLTQLRDSKYRIQPIANANAVIAEAKARLAASAVPEARLLPTVPSEPFPKDQLRAPGRGHWEREVYSFRTDDFYVELVTPIARYEINTENYQQELKEYGKHPKGRTAPAEPEYNYDAVLMIAVIPKTKVPFWENMARMNNRTIVRYKTGFSKLRLLCGDKEVIPIWPGHVTEGSKENHYAVLVDESSGGRYIYPYDAISPQCGRVTVQVFSTKDAGRPSEKVLDPAQVQRIWQDFEPYRQMQAKHTETAER